MTMERTDYLHGGVLHVAPGSTASTAVAPGAALLVVRVRDRFLGELRPLVVREEHYKNRIRKHHASRRVIGKFRIVDGSDRLVEGLGPGEVADGQVDEDLLGHEGCSTNGSS